MKKNTILTFIFLATLNTSCQLTSGDFLSGKAQGMAKRVSRESDILDVVDDVVREEEGQGVNEDLRGLTDNYTNFPTSYDITDYINGNVSALGTQCAMTDHEREWSFVKSVGTGSIGARKVLATIYQSCEPIDTVIDSRTPSLSGVSTQEATFSDGTDFKQRVVHDVGAMVRSHEVLRKLDEDPGYPGEGCIDATKVPPVYGYGSRKGLRSNEINLFTRGQGVSREGARASGIDCSEFISAAYAAEGLKFTSNDRDYRSLTTTSLHDTVRSKNSCIKPVKFKLPYSIRSGDIINVKGSHVIMVDTIGEDPLAIRKFSELGRCDDITISDFNFTYIHSGALKNYGPARVDARTHATHRSTMFANLRAQAVASCKAILSEQEYSNEMMSGRFSILRHNSEDAACYYDEPAKLKGESCINQCLQDKLKEAKNV
ncbi:MULTISPECIES: hypothetical protein [unclassified Halobacteriovorax]|uniref:hypothetical protein n=1 Tax=unclassified Halobacteriovorax TaxID=2639665 RepID=UPI000CD0380D|nr:hypothetical protein [Halobacteriovorax sp. DA5]POB14975.1 hypothetical protein C0Z22_00950 [Halobacteriovorax sp. DA5]